MGPLIGQVRQWERSSKEVVRQVGFVRSGGSAVRQCPGPMGIRNEKFDSMVVMEH